MSFRDIFSMTKKNAKRSRSPTSSPNESNSFVGNVTSRMRKLVPSLSKWFSTSQQPEGSDSSDEEEQQAPPPKRIRISPPEHHSTKSTYVSETTTIESEQKDNILYSSIQAGPSRSTFIREASYSTPYPSSHKENNNEETTNTETGRDTTDRDTTYKAEPTASTSRRTVAAKRKSIFDTDTKLKEEVKPKVDSAQSNPTPKDHREPRFRPSLYSSPFYPGPTMYGGASASSFYNRPIIKYKEIKVKEPPKAASSDLSAASQRIMDLLENYPSPLMEAKRIPVFQRPTPSALRLQPYADASKPNSYKTQELQVASVAKMLRLKQRSKLMETNKVARQIMASHSSTDPDFINSLQQKSDSYKLPDRDSTTKLKTTITRINRGEDPHIMPEPVHLPTAVLQIDKDNLPKFSITSSPFNNTTTNQTDWSQKTNMSPKSTSDTQKMSNEAAMFKFASPVPISQDMNITQVVSSLAYERSPEMKPTTATTAPEPLPASAPLVPLVPLVPLATAEAKKSEEKDWKCDDCWITNKSSVDKCAACGASKPGAKKHAEPPQPQPTAPLPKMDDKLAAIVRAQKSKWECSSCLTSNSNDKSKCQCCDMEREGPSKEITPKPFTFPKESNISFKFGIDPQEQEKNLAKKTEVIKLDTKTPTETNNNIAALPSFAKASNKSDEQDSVVPTQVTFSFGIPKPNTEPAISFATPPQKPTEPSSHVSTPSIFASGFLAPPKPVQDSPPGMSKPSVSEDSRKADVPTVTHVLTTPTKYTSEDINKDATASFSTSDKPLTFSFTAGSNGSNSVASLSMSGGFTFGVNRSGVTTTVTEAVVPSVSIHSSPQPSAAEVPTKNVLGVNKPTPSTQSAPPPAQSAATPLFSFGTNGPSPARPPTMFSFGTPNNESTPFGNSNKEPTPFGAPNKEATPFGVPNKDATPFGGPNKEANPFGIQNSTEATPFGAPNKEATPFGTTNNKDSTPFGTTNKEASPFGVPNSFMMNTNSNNGGNGMSTPMSASEGSTATATFGANDSRPFAFGSSNAFGASPASNPPPTIFSTQPAAQSVFSPTTTQSSGLFASPQQPMPMFGTQNIFSGLSQPPAFGTQSQPSMFGNQSQPSNAFGASTSTPAPAFGAQNQLSTFGSPNQNQSPAFGAPSQSSAFGAPTNQPTAFGAPSNQPTAFGAPSNQPTAFGTTSQNQAPAFGVTSQPAASSAPMFNFGSQASSSQGIFGFGQQQQQQQQQQPTQQSAFNFGSNTIGGLHTSIGGMGGMIPPSMDPSLGGVQFNVGSAPAGNSARRMRKAVRRTQPR